MSKMIPHFYDFSKVTINLPSRERLVKKLGDYDALAEYSLLSVLYFEKEIKQQLDERGFVNQKAQEFDIKLLAPVKWDNYHEALYKSFMVNSCAMFDEFINKLRQDIKILVDPMFSFVDDNNINDYERLKRSLKKYGIDVPIPVWLDQLEDYYRTIRNHVAHNPEGKNKSREKFDNINLEAMSKDYDVFRDKAPNPPGKLTMYDFYLYSATIKHIANLITMSLVDRIKWDNIGNTHPELLNRHPEGTDKRKLAISVFSRYDYHYSKEELDRVTNDIRVNWQKNKK